MRKSLVAANWKMNLDTTAVGELLADISTISVEISKEIIIAPSFIYLSQAINQLKHTAIKVAAQNLAATENGPYTGEVSASMLSDLGVTYVIIGHSERRAYFGETIEILNKKINQALSNNLKIIFCIGESLEHREKKQYEEIINEQLTATLFKLPEDKWSSIVIAYEPVWAIGTGLSATQHEAQAMHSFIRKLVSVQYNAQIANNLSIIYGGSCNRKNAKELFTCNDIDGGLIGGASLNFDDFFSITQSI